MTRERAIFIGLLVALAGALTIAILLVSSRGTRVRAAEAAGQTAGRALMKRILDRASKDAERLSHPENAPPVGLSDQDPSWQPHDREIVASCQNLFEDADEALATFDALGPLAWADADSHTALSSSLTALDQAPAQCFAKVSVHMDGSAAAVAAQNAIAAAQRVVDGGGK